MSSAGTAIQPVYVSLLSDISNPGASQTAAPPLGFFSQVMAHALAAVSAAASAAAGPVAASGKASASSPTASSPIAGATNTIQVQFDTTPGPLYGNPIAPSGSSETGQWAILPAGSYFSASDVSADGTATLTAPPADWQSTPTGQTLTSPAGSANGADAAGPSSSPGVPATGAPIGGTAASSAAATPPAGSLGTSPHTIQVQFDMTPGPLYGRPIAPEGSMDVGPWTVLPDGSYFSAADVSADGIATLTPPPAGWQNTATGDSLAALMANLSANA